MCVCVSVCLCVCVCVYAQQVRHIKKMWATKNVEKQRWFIKAQRLSSQMRMWSQSDALSLCARRCVSKKRRRERERERLP